MNILLYTFLIVNDCVSLAASIHIPCTSYCVQVSGDECGTSPCLFGCKTGWFGSHCDKRCSSLCSGLSCFQYNGSCSEGAVLPWKSEPKRLRGLKTKVSKRSTDKCHKTKDGKCICCKSGYRGDDCQTVCENCRTVNNDQIGCKYLCASGYYGETCNNSCPERCTKGITGVPVCGQDEEGTVQCLNGCIEGYFGQLCDKRCSDSCEGKKCYQHSGSCVNCIDGFHGDNCNAPCKNTCVENKCFKNGTCKLTCPVNCRIQPNGQLCTRTDDGSVKCTECTDGFYGPICNLPCFEHCQRCNVLSGDCPKCRDQWYGDSCDKQCSSNCDGGCFNNGTCRACIKGRYGGSCDFKCGENCYEGRCTVHNTTDEYYCHLGCKDGYAGHDCEQECTRGCQTCNQNSTEICVKFAEAKNRNLPSNSHVLPVLAVCLPVAFSIVVLLLVWLFLRYLPRFYKHRTGGRNRESNNLDPESQNVNTAGSNESLPLIGASSKDSTTLEDSQDGAMGESESVIYLRESEETKDKTIREKMEGEHGESLESLNHREPPSSVPGIQELSTQETGQACQTRDVYGDYDDDYNGDDDERERILSEVWKEKYEAVVVQMNARKASCS